MPKTSGLGDNCWIGGQNISGDVNSLSNIHGGPAPWDVTGIDKFAIERTGLLRDGGFSFVAFHNPTGAHPVLRLLPYQDVLATYLRGTAVGNDAANCWAKQLNYDPTRGQDGALTFAVEVVANGYGLEWGVQYTAGARTDTTATNGPSVDFGAATAFGMQAYLHVQSVTGTSVTVKMQDSADNTTFADITGLTFSAVAPGPIVSQRMQTANNATIRRYVRAVTTGTFSNAVFQVSATRNETAGVSF